MLYAYPHFPYGSMCLKNLCIDSGYTNKDLQLCLPKVVVVIWFSIRFAGLCVPVLFMCVETFNKYLQCLKFFSTVGG